MITLVYNPLTGECRWEEAPPPRADLVAVVRCKDCKWGVEHDDTDGNVPYWVCINWDGGTDADGYCHEAERRTDETD